jgi:glutamine amidotransferase
VWRKPVAANRSETFVTGAHQAHSRTFLAHIRHATAEPPSLENTHPFEQHGRLFAHNGVLAELDRLRARLGEHAELLRGSTDSELYFTLVTKRIEEHGGDVAAGIAAAANELADDQPLYSLNMVLTTATDMWALRYPDTNELWILERTLGSLGDLSADTGITRVFSGQLAVIPATVIASQPMDSSPGWRMLESGELIHVDQDLNVTSEVVVDHPPATLMELTAKEAVAQAESG